ncbi:MAG TPA: hypothetical protein VFO88_04800 [Gaiellaceae bacterium]|nr:hypothetical protein [Gaiellaceae bacterium]
MDDEPRIDWDLEDALIQLLMRIDAKLDVLIELFEDEDGEEETDL